MISGTTPTLRLTINALNLTECSNIHVTLKQRSITLDFTELTISEHVIEVYLTQADSLKLIPGDCKIQVNGLLNGSRWATNTEIIEITEQLLREVIA